VHVGELCNFFYKVLQLFNINTALGSPIGVEPEEFMIGRELFLLTTLFSYEFILTGEEKLSRLRNQIHARIPMKKINTMLSQIGYKIE